jgi:glycosyltransferase involved in cell wall biosynthesis
MRLEDITPVILTLNEAPNIARTLERLQWAKRIVVVDSYSDDETCAIVARYPQAVLFQRRFDSHANQWNYAISETDINTDWVLALDADYVLSAKLVDELGNLAPPRDVSGYRARFVYCIEGKPLRATVYTLVTVLFRRDRARYAQDGHTQRIRLNGRIEFLSNTIYHDDRKDLSSWVAAQNHYVRTEAEKLLNAEWKTLRWTERIRRLRVVAPFAMLFYCLFVKGLILDGRAGIFYSFQRAFAELLLSLYMIQNDLARGRGPRG